MTGLPFDLVVMAKADVESWNHQQLTECLTDLLQQTKSRWADQLESS